MGPLQQAMPRLVLVTVTCVLLGVGGCSGTPEPPSPPTAADLRGLARFKRYPIFWLGPSARGGKLATAGTEQHGAKVSYGPASCTDSGCSFPVTVLTDSARSLYTDPPFCWRRLGRAYMYGCRSYSSVDVYTSDVIVSVEAEAAERLAQRLRPVNDRTFRSAGFEPPRPLPCAQQRKLPRRFARSLPSALRGRCPVR